MKEQIFVSSSNGESGQAAISLVLMLGIFLLAALAFSVDLVNMWFHRQAVQTAADAACQAGEMNMLDAVSGISMANMGFTVGTAGDCVGSPSASICKYAGFNGYTGSGYTSTTSGSTVSWTFPASVSGITAPSATLTTNPFLQVTVTENVKTWFMGLLGFKYQKVAAVSTCGLVPVKAAPPLVVLNPSISGALSEGGSSTVAVIGGPQRSLQVNSTSTTAVSLGGTSALDFSKAGPSGTGGDLGVVGGPSTNPGGYSGGTTGRWLSPSSPLPDPYGSVPAPAKPAQCTSCSGTAVPHYWDGCPDPNGCTEYSPGYYPSGITVKQTTAIFLPGLYYLGGDFSANSLSTVRNGWTYHSTTGPVPAPSAADGVMFYLTNGAGMSFGSNSGSSTLDPLPSSYLLCNSSQTLPSGVPSTLNGSVLWAQCTANGTYDNYANLGTHSPDTESTAGSRGLLMFLDHSSSPPKNLSAGGGGSMAFAGAFYFHQATSYGDLFSLSGGSGTGTYVIGKIVADQLYLGGNGSITMALSSDASTYLLKTGIFQ
ncbi:MAG TPA: Tad domain-containing protein [Edaphobacter sp.]|nr:Tad domain-containing protein [Edaphobacter sp.]